MRRIAGTTTLHGFAVGLVAGLILVLAQLTPAAAQGGKYHEAPGLAEQVKAGKLPPVEQRLPEAPLVVPVVEKVGEYGGVWRRAFLGPADANNYVRVVYDGLFRFTPDGAEIEPKIAAGREVVGRLQGLDDPAAQGRPLVRRRTVHRRRHHVLVQGCPAEQGPDAFAAELDPQCRWNALRRWRRWTITRCSSPTTDRPRCSCTEVANQDGPDWQLRHVPAGALPEEVPSRLHRQGGRRSPGAGGQLQDLDRTVPVRKPRRRRIRSARRWRRGCR